jgi:hypothetical protein
MSTNYEVPHCVTSSILPSPRALKTGILILKQIVANSVVFVLKIACFAAANYVINSRIRIIAAMEIGYYRNQSNFLP